MLNLKKHIHFPGSFIFGNNNELGMAITSILEMAITSKLHISLELVLS